MIKAMQQRHIQHLYLVTARKTNAVLLAVAIQLVVDEFRSIIAIDSRKRERLSSLTIHQPCKDMALRFVEHGDRFRSVQPVHISITLSVLMYSPTVVEPQCSARSISSKPGTASSHSWPRQIGIRV